MRAAFIVCAMACTSQPAPQQATPPPAADQPAAAAAKAPAPRPPDPPAQPGKAEPTPGDASPEMVTQCTEAAATLGAGDGSKTADALNTAGFRCYRADRLNDAIALFSAAIDHQPTHALAHYNLAATLGVVRQRGDICGADATLHRIMKHIEAAVKIDPNRRKRLAKDPDLDPVRTLPRFRMLQGADSSSRRGVVTAVQEATFYAPAMGAYGHPAALTLQGQAPHKDLDDGALPTLNERRTVTDDGQLKTTTSIGGWAVDDAGWVLIDPDGGEPGPEVERWRLTTGGDLEREGASATRMVGLPDECSA